MPGQGGLCFCACDSDSDASFVYVKQQQQGKSRAIAAGLEIAKKGPPSPIQERTSSTTPTSTPDKNSENTSFQQTTTATKKKKSKKQLLSKAKQGSMRQSAAATTAAAANDEYIDYSASTSVERLARDVETVLRTWHVVDGSDRHASLHLRSNNSAPSSPQKQALSSTPTTTQTPLLNPSHKSVQLIRSEQLAWKMSFYLPHGQQIVQQIDLELALWDGDGQNQAYDEENESLPLSLRRATGLKHFPLNLFNNFSTLFGIGQHITLTPLLVQLGEDLWGFLSDSIQQRHHKTTALPCITSILSGWLQTALNLATMSSQCFLPAFGVWGPYQPQKQQFSHFLAGDAASILPAWLQASQQLQVKEQIYRRRRKKQQQTHLNRNYVPPVLTGQCLTAIHHKGDTGHHDDDDQEKQVVFWTSLLPHLSNARLSGTDSRLTVWGDVLLRHCADECVALWGARHVYTWTRPTPATRYTGLFAENDDWDDKIWRKGPSLNLDDEGDAAVIFRWNCQRHALHLIEQAANTTDADPLWGPVQDPLASIHATVTWNATEGENGLQPLLSLPLKIRSRQTMSREDWIEAEEAIEHSILDPYRPGVFVVQVHGDAESAQATLTATQRCVLAALIRTATLPAETMLSHLLDEQILDGWNTKAGNEIANQIADRIRAQPGTRALVAAMDWEDASDDMISTEEAEEIVANIINNQVMIGYPEQPEGYSGSIGPEVDELWKPLLKSAPFGRLVSHLFVHMASVRSPSSIVLVFSTFCRELRRRWDNRESLPNMNFIPGLDPSPDSYMPKRCFSNVGEKATFAAQVNSSEPDPDDWNCLVGQKLQVFNLCIESAIVEQLRNVELIEKRPFNDPQFQTPTKGGERPTQRPRLDQKLTKNLSEDTRDNGVIEMGVKDQETAIDIIMNDDVDLTHGADESDAETDNDFRSVTSMGHDSDHLSVSEHSRKERFSGIRMVNNTGSVYLEQNIVHRAANTPATAAKSKSLMSGSLDISPKIDGGSDLDEDTSSRDSRNASAKGQSLGDGTKSMTSQNSAYYDADDGEGAPSILQMIMGKTGGEHTASASVLELIMGKDTNAERRGARCPVQGATLQNGEQVYAPYLRRPFPLTDDVIIQRRLMLSRQKTSVRAASATALEQLDIAHRFQQPKLAADMSAFKAANPWASFEDFTAWYGNPVNPLEEYEEARSQDIRLGFISDDTVQSSILKTSESAVLLDITKQFWMETWNKTQPRTAAENDPLFDPVSTVEMALDNLETMHPATLLCNVLAVNLSAAYFGLVFSAAEAIQIPSIRMSLRRLRKKIEIALQLLSLDAVTSGQAANPLHPGLSSVEAMTACENACIVLGENEVLLARGRSLLSKFPGKFALIDRILKASEGSVITVDDDAEQRDILRAVLSHRKDPTSVSARPSPTLREYLLRNDDNENPCQLCVRYGNYVKDLDGEGGLLMAITKTHSGKNHLASSESSKNSSSLTG